MQAVSDFVFEWLGEISAVEFGIVLVLFGCILGFAWAPRMGESLARWWVGAPPDAE